MGLLKGYENTIIDFSDSTKNISIASGTATSTVPIDAGANKITTSAAATADNDVVNLATYNAKQNWKSSCYAIYTTNVASLSGAIATDGVTPPAGSRVMLAGQTAGAGDGIYVTASGTWSRATDWDTGQTIVQGTGCWIENGTSYANSFWASEVTGVVGTDDLDIQSGPVSKAYIDALAALRVLKAGDTMTGLLNANGGVAILTATQALLKLCALTTNCLEIQKNLSNNAFIVRDRLNAPSAMGNSVQLLSGQEYAVAATNPNVGTGSWSMAFRSKTVTRKDYAISFRDTGATNSLGMSLDTNGKIIDMYVVDSVGTYKKVRFTIGSGYTYGDYHSIYMTWNSVAQSASLWFNGVSIAAGTTEAITNPYGAAEGGYRVSVVMGTTSVGYLDDIRIYNAIKDITNATAVFNNYIGDQTADTADLIAHWKCDEVNGTIVTTLVDETANNNDLVVNTGVKQGEAVSGTSVPVDFIEHYDSGVSGETGVGKFGGVADDTSLRGKQIKFVAGETEVGELTSTLFNLKKEIQASAAAYLGGTGRNHVFLSNGNIELCSGLHDVSASGQISLFNGKHILSTDGAMALLSGLHDITLSGDIKLFNEQHNITRSSVNMFSGRHEFTSTEIKFFNASGSPQFSALTALGNYTWSNFVISTHTISQVVSAFNTKGSNMAAAMNLSVDRVNKMLEDFVRRGDYQTLPS